MTHDGNVEGRVVVNWTACDWQPFPGCGGVAWHPIREASEPDDGFYLLRIPAGERAPRRDADVSEEFIVLQGSLIDSDGATLVDGDFVSYRPGTDHEAMSPDGCILAWMTKRSVYSTVSSAREVNCTESWASGLTRSIISTCLLGSVIIGCERLTRVASGSSERP